MLLAKIAIYFLSLLTNCITCENDSAERGKNYTIYQIIAFTAAERNILQYMQQTLKHTSFLNGITNEAALPIYVAVDNCCLKIFTDTLSKYAIFYAKISDYRYEPHDMKHNQTRYLYTWNHISSWIKKILRKYPKSIKESIIGRTFENKDLTLLKVSTGRRKPVIFIVGGEDGRDWTSAAIILQFIKNILENNLEELRNFYDFFFIPIFNPDGYSFSSSKERFWAKNRKQFYSKKLCPDNTLALGVNIDRNWFEESQGFEKGECSNFYPGEHPLSEEETMALASLIDRIAPRTIAFFNLRAFDQLITIPYAQSGKLSMNHNTLVEIFNFACEHLAEEYNMTYFLGSASKFFYNFSGNCADWVKKNLNVPVVATIYMRHEHSIIADEEDITPLYEQFETLMVDVLDLAKDLYGPLFNMQRRHSISITTYCILITIHVIF
ncbi:zinc carboxypeptidase-like isoform X2 [Choristoneura fumiferana]|uniref:zinc carboxypeptidase-like isoform X2 n=1 Tax=Choristoneura fumiferana TaxID=7141 RepID=UPI003D159F05